MCDWCFRCLRGWREGMEWVRGVGDGAVATLGAGRTNLERAVRLDLWRTSSVPGGLALVTELDPGVVGATAAVAVLTGCAVACTTPRGRELVYGTGEYLAIMAVLLVFLFVVLGVPISGFYSLWVAIRFVLNHPTVRAAYQAVVSAVL